MTQITLTHAELTAITGLKQKARMAKWLGDRGWVFEPPRRRGELPVVDRAYYLGRMSGAITTERKSRLRLDRM